MYLQCTDITGKIRLRQQGDAELPLQMVAFASSACLKEAQSGIKNFLFCYFFSVKNWNLFV